MTGRKWSPIGGFQHPWIDDDVYDDGALSELARTVDTGTRNGMPEPGGYVHGAKDAAREAEFEARMAALRARFPANYSTEAG